MMEMRRTGAGGIGTYGALSSCDYEEQGERGKPGDDV